MIKNIKYILEKYYQDLLNDNSTVPPLELIEAIIDRPGILYDVIPESSLTLNQVEELYVKNKKTEDWGVVLLWDLSIKATSERVRVIAELVLVDKTYGLEKAYKRIGRTIK